MVSNRRTKAKETAVNDKGKGKIFFTMRSNPAVTVKGNTIEKYFAPKSASTSASGGDGGHLQDLLEEKDFGLDQPMSDDLDIPESGRKPAQKVNSGRVFSKVRLA